MAIKDRRSFLLGCGCGAAALAMPGVAQAARLASRRFRIWRGGDEIGLQTVELLRSSDALRVEIEIDIAVKLLGITVYGYRMRNVETWSGGMLRELSAETDDDGTTASVTVRRRDDMLEVAGSGYQGIIPGDAATTSYWSPDFLRRGTWISTYDGTPMSVRTAQGGSAPVRLATGEVTAAVWNVSGDLDLALLYAGQEWVANHFTARGEQARIVAEDTRTPFAPHFTA